MKRSKRLWASESVLWAYAFTKKGTLRKEITTSWEGIATIPKTQIVSKFGASISRWQGFGHRLIIGTVGIILMLHRVDIYQITINININNNQLRLILILD